MLLCLLIPRYTPTMSHVIQRFIGFAGTGAIATGIQYLILIILHELFSLPAVLSSSVGYGIAAIANYLMKYHWVFGSDEHHHVAGPKYAIVSLTGLSLNTLLMYLGIELLDIHYLVAQVISTLLVLIWNFSVNSVWTFRTAERNPDT